LDLYYLERLGRAGAARAVGSASSSNVEES